MVSGLCISLICFQTLGMTPTLEEVSRTAAARTVVTWRETKEDDVMLTPAGRVLNFLKLGGTPGSMLYTSTILY